MSIDFGTLTEETAITTATKDPSANPAIPAVQASWDARKADAKGVERGTTLGVTVDTADADKTVSQLRAAAAHLGIGLSVQIREIQNSKGQIVEGQRRVAFSAKTKRASNK